MNVKWKAKKILEPMISYFPIEGESSCIHLWSNFILKSEEPIGVYRNEKDNNILITTQGVHVIKGKEHLYCRYKEIEKISFPDADKQKISFIELELSDKKKIVVPVKNGNGRFRDVFEFMRFIRNATSLSQKES